MQSVLKVHFARIKNLACVTNYAVDGKNSVPYILVSAIFNHAETPREVIKYVLKHEYLHLDFPHMGTGDPEKDHPPEFKRRLEGISPEGAIVNAWIYISFHRGCRNVNSKNRYWEVTAKGYKILRTGSMCSLGECAEMLGMSVLL
jgi:hypothetical protein